ncbi:MAG: flagellar hook-length control protein FliK, partial [Actinomycetota bacterium]
PLTPGALPGRSERAAATGTEGSAPGLPAAAAAGPGLPFPTATPATPLAPTGGPLTGPASFLPGVLPGVTAALLAPVWPLRRGPDGVHRLTVRLHPDELGEVGVTVTLRGGRVDLALVSGSDSSREVLRAALPDLRRELTAGGLVAGFLDVRADTPNGNGGPPPGWSGPQPAWPDGSGDRGARRTPTVTPAAAPAGTAPTRDLPGPAGLDLHL